MWESKNKKISAALVKPLQGLRFGKLTVLRFHEIRDHRAFWICRCDCGKEKSIVSSSLSPHGSKSCGCGHFGMKTNRKSRPLADRFWEKVNKTDTCWLWTASVNNMGYGEFKLPGATSGVEYSHRMSWIIHSGPIPDGMNVLHHCDTPRCVRPDHLFLGTQKDNVHDCFNKRRNPVLINGPGLMGESHGMAKLTEEQVIDIRSRYISGVNKYNPSNRQELAEEFNITPNHVWQVKKGNVWKHLL
jgi:hypothetical protein